MHSRNRLSKTKVEEQKAQIEELKAEVEKRIRVHETAIANVQSKDQIIARYCNKTKRCSHALEVVLKADTSNDVMIDVIWDLINIIIH